MGTLVATQGSTPRSPRPLLSLSLWLPLLGLQVQVQQKPKVAQQSAL